MSFLKIFVSFEYDKDNELRGHFYTQAKTHSTHVIQDCSLRQDYPSEKWRAKARTAILGCDVVIVLVGADTHNAPGVRTEVEMACQLRKPVFQVVPQERPYQGVPTVGDRIRWKWSDINRHLNSLRLGGS